MSGLAPGTKYLFRTESRNLYDSTTVSSLSAADSATTSGGNTKPLLFDTTGSRTTLQAEQRKDGTDTLDLYYQILDIAGSHGWYWI